MNLSSAGTNAVTFVADAPADTDLLNQLQTRKRYNKTSVLAQNFFYLESWMKTESLNNCNNTGAFKKQKFKTFKRLDVLPQHLQTKG